MRRAVGALVALGLVVGLLGTAVVGSAMAMFGIDVAAHGDVGRHLQDPARHAGALSGGGGHLPGPALDDPGRHRHRRV